MDRKTQKSKVVHHMEKIGPITPWIAWEFYHITRLAPIICELSKGGMPIKREMQYKRDAGGNIVSKWMEYWL